MTCLKTTLNATDEGITTNDMYQRLGPIDAMCSNCTAAACCPRSPSKFKSDRKYSVELTCKQWNRDLILGTHSAMLAWMGGKRSKLKHARKHHVSKPGQNRTSTANAGCKRPVASPTNGTRARPAKRTKNDVHKRASDRGKEVVSTAEQGQAPVSSNSSDLEGSPSVMDEQEANDDHSYLQGNAHASSSTCPEDLPQSRSCRAAKKFLEASQELQSKCTRGPKQPRTAAVSLDLQAIQLPG